MNFTKSLIPAFFCVGVFCCLIFPAQAEEVIWHQSGDITSPTVWREGEVHVIADGSFLSIMPEASLTLEAGTIVKVGFDSHIDFYGDFTIAGTAEKPVYVVSLRDDSIAGDTNGDGSATSVDYGDWRGLDFSGHLYRSEVNVDINYAIIKHGGGVHLADGIENNVLLGAFGVESFKLRNSQLINSKGVIITDAYSKNVSIHNCNFYRDDCNYQTATDNCQYSLGYRSWSSTDQVDVVNNYWGSPNGPTYTTGTQPEFYNGIVLVDSFSNINYLPYAVEPFDLFNIEKKLNPVLVVPGIMGSWQNYLGSWKIDPILHTYDDLLEALRLAGYKDGETLFTFPYNWRYSNVLNANYLKLKIETVKSSCQGENFDCSKVDLITHSMGGLIAREYIAGDYYVDDVDQLIFVATPHRGSPKLYLLWEGGELEPGFKDLPLKLIFELEAKENGYWGTEGLTSYMRDNDFSSVKELLPVYSYLYDKEDNYSILRQYPENYPRNEFLERLNSASALQSLEGVKLLNITADTGGVDTLIALELVESNKPNLWQYGMPYNFYNFSDDDGLIYGSGDQSVPAISNSNFLGLEPVVFNSDHGGVVTDAQKTIIKELTGVEPEIEFRGLAFPNILLIMMHSPADFLVIDPLGQRVGRNINEVETEEVLAEIPEAFYSGFSDQSQPEFVIIPNPLSGEYRIETLGNEAGGYGITVDYFSTNSSSSLSYSGLTAVNQLKELEFSFESEVEFSNLTNLQTDIDIFSALDDVEQMFKNKLLTGNKTKLSLMARYKNLNLKVKLKDDLIIKLNKVIADIEKKPWPEILKQKYLNIYQTRINTVNTQRAKLITTSLNNIDSYASNLVVNGSLDSLGYAIIKSNNDYLLLNW